MQTCFLRMCGLILVLNSLTACDSATNENDSGASLLDAGGGDAALIDGGRTDGAVIDGDGGGTSSLDGGVSIGDAGDPSSLDGGGRDASFLDAGSGPCDGVICNTPPNACLRSIGTCTGDGTCEYSPDNGATCDDGDACTNGDSCGDGVCAGTPLVCTAPPSSACIDDSTLRSFESAGTCGLGTCIYSPTDVSCAFGCDADLCVPNTWERQFGTSALDGANSVALDQSGNVYVAGRNAFLRKYDVEGQLLWAREFGASTDAVSSVSIDTSENVYVVGATNGDLEGVSSGGSDVFIRKYNSDGDVMWTRQFGTSMGDFGTSVASDDTGNVYVSGYTYGGLEGAILGGADAFVRKYDGDGAVLWTRQFGTDVDDWVGGVALDAAGEIYLAGATRGALEGPNAGTFSDAFVRKYSSDGAVVWTRQFGSSTHDDAKGLAIDGSGGVYLVGLTFGALGSTGATGTDAFVRKYSSDGVLRWTRQFGDGRADFAIGASTDESDNVYIAGQTIASPDRDASEAAFIRRYTSDGDLDWTRILDSGMDDFGSCVVIGSGGIYLAGATEGILPGQASAGGQDAFLVRIEP